MAAAAALIAGLVLPVPARADPGSAAPNPFVVAFDVALLRPIGLIATIVGFGFFVPAAVVTAPGGRDSIREAWELFVLVPGDYVFERPLGNF